MTHAEPDRSVRPPFKDLVARYKSGYDAVVAALEGITDQELDRDREDGEWTPRQVVHHLADAEMTSAIRLRRLLAEERPVIYGYDQDTFTERLHYDRPIEASLAAFEGARLSTATLLDRLAEADPERHGWHDEMGMYSVRTWLEVYAAHAHNHAEQIRRSRR